MEASRSRSTQAPDLATRIAALVLVAITGAPATGRGDATTDVSAPLSAEPRQGSALDGAGLWFSVGALAGSAQPAAALADYQWDTTPRAAWGVQTLCGAGRFATGLRLWSTRTRQAIDSNQGSSVAVRATTWELIGRGRLATVWSTQVLAAASAGLLHLGYEPDRVTLASYGAGPPIVVDLEPLNEWITGGGLAFRRSLGRTWTAGLEVEHRIFGLDTAHRNGDTIEVGRESFGDWSARFEFAWAYQRP